MGFPDDPVARAAALLGDFRPDLVDFSLLRTVSGPEVPEPFRTLLDHRSHMTVAMERHHGGPMRLRVVQVGSDPGNPSRYSREILLESLGGQVVQYGIVRLDLAAVDAATAAAIRAAELPLGRLLIASQPFREIHRVSLLAVDPGPGLAGLFGVPPHCGTYGRVAEIAISGRPAVELLEIAAPQRR